MENRLITRIQAIPGIHSYQGLVRARQRVAVYARVSTDHEDQKASLDAQIDYYTKKIADYPGWNLVEVYADDGISGLRRAHRDGFNRMISHCDAGEIDLILTKSISRFARNTLDSITVVRKLRDKGIGVYFEKEAIFTLEPKGEFILTLMSSLAQEESRSISENTAWGKRKCFAAGKSSLGYSQFLGYDKGQNKFEIIVNRKQAIAVKRIYRLFLQGFSAHTIAEKMTEAGIPTPSNGSIWSGGTVQNILRNEKYKGDAMLQKSFTINFLTKKARKNEGQLPRYYVHNDHEAIVPPWLFDYVQKKMEERSLFATGRYSGHTFWSSKIICGKCGAVFGPRPWHSTSYNNSVWQCRNRYKILRCKTHNIYDKLLHYILHDAARRRLLLCQVSNVVLEVLHKIVPSDKEMVIQRAVGNFQERTAWQLLADEDDLALAIKQILVSSTGCLNFIFLDDSKIKYRLPKYSPKRGIFLDE